MSMVRVMARSGTNRIRLIHTDHQSLLVTNCSAHAGRVKQQHIAPLCRAPPLLVLRADADEDVDAERAAADAREERSLWLVVP